MINISISIYIYIFSTLAFPMIKSYLLSTNMRAHKIPRLRNQKNKEVTAEQLFPCGSAIQ